MSTLEELESPGRPTHPWCLFHGGQGGYAIGLEAVAEVVEFDRLVRLPHSPPRVAGLCILRRDVLPVIALEPGDTSEPSEGRGKQFVLILKTAQGTWGVQVAGEGTVVAEEVLEALGPVANTSAPWLAFIGAIRRGETVYPVIDPEATWKNVRQGVESYYAGRWVDATQVRRG